MRAKMMALDGCARTSNLDLQKSVGGDGLSNAFPTSLGENARTEA